jgi:general L-amino acid transport system permease protein
VVVIVLGFLWLNTNLQENLARQNFGLGFDFLSRQAGFGIGESVIPYHPTDPYAQALAVGLLNTLRVVVLGLILATGIGILVGIGRLSSNWLVRQLASLYVEILRNTPLLLQLLFWYAVVFLRAPPNQSPLVLLGAIYLSKQGVVFPTVQPTAGAGVWGVCAGLALLGLLVGWRWQQRRRQQMGWVPRWGQMLPWLGGGTLLGIAYLASGGMGPLQLVLPAFSATGQRLQGLFCSAEFSALVIGLSLYTAAFIAEIVRAGITAVPKGQWEAAQSLGLPFRVVMPRIIFPQALRVIVPPLTSQYLNLAKNSSLGTAVAYADIYAVASPTYNQTGRPIEVILLLMATYLVMSLTIAGVMNWYNRRIQLV